MRTVQQYMLQAPQSSVERTNSCAFYHKQLHLWQENLNLGNAGNNKCMNNVSRMMSHFSQEQMY